MDNKCRICLGYKKNIRSIFDTPSQDDYSFAHMIAGISNVKIGKCDGVTDKICLQCRKKLKEAHDFKLQIERSDAALQSSASTKKIQFDNLYDIKIKIEVEVPKYERNMDKYFKDGETCISYNGTTIKKLEPCDTDIKNESGPLSVLDLLNTIKNEDDNDFNDNDYDVHYEALSDAGDEDYMLPLNKRLKTKKYINKGNRNSKPQASKQSRFTPVCIKPTYLGDLRVVPTNHIDHNQPKIKKKYKSRPQPPSMCNICGKMTQSIKSHLLSHSGERSFKCSQCGKGFLTQGSLNHHEKLRHIKERNFKCDKCIASFTTNGALKSHMKRHNNEKKYVCDICNKEYSRQSVLMVHTLRHNIVNKCIKCDLCSMSFFTKNHLKHHIRIHTGERPYNCEICSQPYSYKHDFNRHCLKKHRIFSDAATGSGHERRSASKGTRSYARSHAENKWIRGGGRTSQSFRWPSRPFSL